MSVRITFPEGLSIFVTDPARPAYIYPRPGEVSDERLMVAEAIASGFGWIEIRDKRGRWQVVGDRSFSIPQGQVVERPVWDKTLTFEWRREPFGPGLP